MFADGGAGWPPVASYVHIYVGGVRGDPIVADLGDAGEVLRYVVGFWAFLLSPKYRDNTLRSWRQAGRGTKSMMVLEGGIATLVGLGLPLIIAWLLASLL